MKTLQTALALTLLAAGTLAFAGCRHHGDPARFQTFLSHRVDDMLDDVKATDTQRQQIRAIADRLLADGKALHAGHDEVRDQLLALWQSDQPDASQVHAVVDARAASMKAFADEVADAVLQVHGILTPEQRAQVTAKIKRHMQE